MSLRYRGVLAVICLSFLTSVTFAEELDNMDEGTAAAYGLHLAEKFAAFVECPDPEDQVRLRVSFTGTSGFPFETDFSFVLFRP